MGVNGRRKQNPLQNDSTLSGSDTQAFREKEFFYLVMVGFAGLLLLSFCLMELWIKGLWDDYSIVSLDSYLSIKILSLRNSFGLELFSKITMLGNWQVISGGIVLVLIYLLVVAKRRDLFFPFLVSMLGCSVFTAITKELLKRQRPFNLTDVLGYSFPSGHTSHTACFYGFVLFLLLRKVKKPLYKVGGFILWLGITSLVGFSRLYLDVHYLSDVLAGAFLGSAWLLVGISMVGLFNVHYESIHHYYGHIVFNSGKFYTCSVFLFLVAWFILYLIVAFIFSPEYVPVS